MATNTIMQQNASVIDRTHFGGDFAVADRNESKIFPDGSSLVRVEEIPWSPWVMEGTEFKLLYINRAHAMFTALIRMPPNLETPDHHHFGEAHAYVLEGE